MNRRDFCASMSVAVLGSTVRAEPTTAPGVIARRTYDDLLVKDLTTAHDGGLALAGWTVDFQGMRVAVTDSRGRIRNSQRLKPPEEMEGRPVPAITRTADGYAVSSGGWIGILAPDLTVEAKTIHPEWYHLGNTQVVAAGPGIVVANEYDMPDHVSVMVTGYDTDGNYRWHWHSGSEWSHTFGFLVPDPNGVVVGGGNLATGGLWTAGLAPDGDQRWSSTNTSLGTKYGPAATFDDGLILFDGTTLRKLDDDRSVVWERSYDSFSDVGPRLVSLPEGGTLAGTGTTIGAFGPDGRARWVREYDVDGESLGGLRVLGDGEYVAAGSTTVGDSASGWFLRLSSSRTPTASPTPSPTPSATPTVTTGQTATDTSVPGLGLATAFAALAGTAVWLRRRADP